VRWVVLLQFFMYKLNSRRQCIAFQVYWCGYLRLVDELQSDIFLNPEFEIIIVYTPHILQNHINKVNKCNPEKSVSTQGFTTSKVTLWKSKQHSSLNNWMCTKHSMPRRNSNMELIQTSILQPIWSTTAECVQKQISNESYL